MRELIKRLWVYFTEPRSKDLKIAYREYLTRVVLTVILLCAFSLTLIVGISGVMTGFDNETIFIVVLVDTLSISSLLICFRGYYSFASVLPIIGFFVIGVYSSFTNHFPVTGILGYIISILLAGTLVSFPYQRLILIASIISDVIAKRLFADYSNTDSFNHLFSYLIMFSGIAFIQWLAISQLQKFLNRSESFNQDLQKEIAERKLIEVEKQNLHKYYQTTLKHLQNNVARYARRADGEIIFLFNEGNLIKSLGIDTSQVYGKTVDEILGNDTAEEIKPYLEKAFSGEVVSYEATINGIHFSTILSPVELNGSVKEVSGSTVDITETRQSEEALRFSEQRMKAFIANTPVGVVEWDKEGRIQQWNPAAEDIFGWKKDEVIGQFGRDLIIPDKRKQLMNHTFKDIVAEKTGGSMITENLTRDGYIIQCEWINSVLKDMYGHVTGVASVVQEITARIETERLQKAIYQISEAAAITRNLDELYKSVHNIIGGLIPAKNLYIAIYDTEHDLINYPYHVDEEDEHPLPRKPSKGLTEYLLRTGKALLVDPIKFEELVAANEVTNIGTPSVDWMGVPLLDTDQNTYGAIVVQTYTEGERYEKNHLSILNFVSNQVSNAVLRKQSEEKLIESEDRFRSLVEQTSEGIMILDEQGRIIELNRALETITGYSEKEALGKHGWEFLYQILPTEQRKSKLFRMVRSKYQDFIQNKLPIGGDNFFELPIQTKDGSKRYIQQSVFPIKTGHGYHLGAISRDITEQKLIRDELEFNEEQFRTMIENQGEGTGIVDQEEKFIYVNPAAETIFGVLPGELIGKQLKDFMTDEQYKTVLEQTVKRKNGEHSNYELEITRPDTKVITILITATPQFDSTNKYIGTFGVFRDITKRKKDENRLRYYSMHDALTGVYNRAYFDTELARLKKGRSYPVTIFMIDIDDLKGVNDKSGHHAGDQLLKEAAELLISVFRAEDIVARIGGDEFAIVLPMTNEVTAGELLERIHLMLKKHNSSSIGIPVNFSCGFATGDKGTDLDHILKIADANMFKEKAYKKQVRNQLEGN